MGKRNKQWQQTELSAIQLDTIVVSTAQKSDITHKKQKNRKY